MEDNKVKMKKIRGKYRKLGGKGQKWTTKTLKNKVSDSFITIHPGCYQEFSSLHVYFTLHVY